MMVEAHLREKFPEQWLENSAELAIWWWCGKVVHVLCVSGWFCCNERHDQRILRTKHFIPLMSLTDRYQHKHIIYNHLNEQESMLCGDSDSQLSDLSQLPPPKAAYPWERWVYNGPTWPLTASNETSWGKNEEIENIEREVVPVTSNAGNVREPSWHCRPVPPALRRYCHYVRLNIHGQPGWTLTQP